MSARQRDGMARRIAQSLALDLRLEGIGPDALVAALGISDAHAVAVLDGHPSAVQVHHLSTLADLAHVDLMTVLCAVEDGRAGGDS